MDGQRSIQSRPRGADVTIQSFPGSGPPRAGGFGSSSGAQMPTPTRFRLVGPCRRSGGGGCRTLVRAWCRRAPKDGPHRGAAASASSRRDQSPRRHTIPIGASKRHHGSLSGSADGMRAGRPWMAWSRARPMISCSDQPVGLARSGERVSSVDGGPAAMPEELVFFSPGTSPSLLEWVASASGPGAGRSRCPLLISCPAPFLRRRPPQGSGRTQRRRP